MLSQKHFYWEMIKKYVVAFHHIFEDVHVLRRDKDNKIIKDIVVPCSYVGKSKMFYLLQNESGTSSRHISTTLPRMSFLITALAPDVSRKEPQLNEIPIEMDGDREIFMYTPVPYNFSVQFSIWTEYTDDMMQIIEQVGTFFKPDYTLIVEEIPELGIRRNISIVLNQMNLDITNEFGPEEDRTVMADIDFTIKGYLYPPIKDESIIKIINIRFTDDSNRCLDIANINHTFNEITALEREADGAMSVNVVITTNTEN
jgi:hypothetical protein